MENRIRHILPFQQKDNFSKYTPSLISQLKTIESMMATGQRGKAELRQLIKQLSEGEK
jgi:hypothetical protein